MLMNKSLGRSYEPKGRGFESLRGHQLKTVRKVRLADFLLPLFPFEAGSVTQF